jgi:hypothetical protein
MKSNFYALVLCVIASACLSKKDSAEQKVANHFAKLAIPIQ